MSKFLLHNRGGFKIYGVVGVTKICATSRRLLSGHAPAINKFNASVISKSKYVNRIFFVLGFTGIVGTLNCNAHIQLRSCCDATVVPEIIHFSNPTNIVSKNESISHNIYEEAKIDSTINSSEETILNDEDSWWNWNSYLNYFIYDPYDRLCVWSLMIWRATVLSLRFTPVVLTLPLVLLTDNESLFNRYWWSLMKDTVRESGPCVIKFAQWLATRPDIVSINCVMHLQEFQTNAYDHGFEASLRIIKKAFGNNVFTELDVPEDSLKVVGNGCVAQVLAGNTSKKQLIAIKVIHPGIRDSITADIRILQYATWFVETYIPGVHNWSLVESVNEFEALMMSQLDMIEEGKSLDRFRSNFPSSGPQKCRKHYSGGDGIGEHVVFPTPLWPYVTQNVLVETFETGIPCSDMLGFVESSIEQNLENNDSSSPPLPASLSGSVQIRKEVAQIGVNAFLKMIFVDNFVHGDMHPGNILIRCTEDGQGSSRDAMPYIEMVILDAGIVSELDHGDKQNLFDLFKAIARNGGDEAARLMISRSKWNSAQLELLRSRLKDGNRPVKAHANTIRDPDKFCSEMKVLVNEIHEHGIFLGRLSIGNLLERVLMLCREHNVKLDAKFIQIIVAIGIVEGLGKRFDPEMDILGKAIPYIVKATVADKMDYSFSKRNHEVVRKQSVE